MVKLTCIRIKSANEVFYMSQIVRSLDQQQLKAFCDVVAHTSQGLTKVEDWEKFLRRTHLPKLTKE